jgi:general L-amino acid transport system substrate-binding protein
VSGVFTITAADVDVPIGADGALVSIQCVAPPKIWDEPAFGADGVPFMAPAALTRTTDASSLYSMRLTMQNPDDHIVLPEIISKEPLGPVVRQGDDQWFNVVKWTHFVLLNAEEAGVTQANVDEKRKQAQEDKTKGASDPNYKPQVSPDVARILGVEGTFGEGIGLSNDWAYNIIKQMGNYGEIFDRNMGTGSKLQIARGLNALWSKGGIQYAPPVR